MSTFLTTLEGTKLASTSDTSWELFLGGNVILRLEKTGDIFVKEKLVINDVSVVYAVREFFKNVERGTLIEHAD